MLIIDTVCISKYERWFDILSDLGIVTALESALLAAQQPLYLHPRLYTP